MFSLDAFNWDIACCDKPPRVGTVQIITDHGVPAVLIDGKELPDVVFVHTETVDGATLVTLQFGIVGLTDTLCIMEDAE